jgi:glycosyltransferase involved in cell wall biosynthesis
VEFIIRAYSILQERHPRADCKLAICGEGPDEDRLRSLVRDLGIEGSVEFRGQIPEDRLLETYNSFTLFAFPSLQEGFGFPILEAQACGLPVLVLKNAMVPEEVARHAIHCSDEAEMAEQFHRLLSDDQYREGMVREGIDYAATFSVASMAARTVEVYEKALKGGR